MTEQEIIKKHYFREHVASYARHGDLQVINWRNPASSEYAIRYVLDGEHIYITGDFGRAIYHLTWTAELDSFKESLDLAYFSEKLRACDSPTRKYEPIVAIKQFQDWQQSTVKDRLAQLSPQNKCEAVAELSAMEKDLVQCSTIDDMQELIKKYADTLAYLDTNYKRTFGKMGQVIAPRLQCYLIGLQMAARQIKEKDNV